MTDQDVTAEGHPEERRYDISFLTGALVTTLRGENDRQVIPPTAPSELHQLVTLALNAGKRVSAETLRGVVYEYPDQYTNGYVQAPLARMRKEGWPITRGNYKLEVPPDRIDILDFHARAQKFIQSCERLTEANSEEKRELEREGRRLDAMWESDPAEPFRDAPRVASLFDPFYGRYRRFLAAWVSLLDELGRTRDALEVLERLEAISKNNDRTVGELRDQLGRLSVALPKAGSGDGHDDSAELKPIFSNSQDRSLRAAYLTDLARRGATLSFGDPSSWTPEQQHIDHITLEQVWTPLRVADSKTREGKVGTHESMAERDLGTPMLELIRTATSPVVILGDPGSGKSTSIGMIAVDLVTNGGPDIIPIWINLGAVIPEERSDPERLLLTGVPEIELATARRGEGAGRALGALLETAIVDGRAVLLLDGLDEVKDYALDIVRAAVSAVARLTNGTRVIVTCRKFDYRQLTPVRRVQIDRELELLPFDDEEKATYVDRWYTAASLAGGFDPSLAKSLNEALRNELSNNDEISAMAELPLLLALLTVIHSRRELPDSRSMVCDQAIKYMLAEAPPWRKRQPGAAIEASGPIIRLAVEVAFQAHVNEEMTADAEGPGFTDELIAAEAQKLHNTLKLAGPTHDTPRPDSLKEHFLNSHGLLLKSAPGRYKFSHRYFQEFLAGQHYARGADQSEAIKRSSSLHWREPFRLMASLAGHDGQALFAILSLIEDLLSSSGPLASKQLAAEMLAEITRPRLALWGFESVLGEATGDRWGGLWALARAMVADQVEDSSLTLPERERAGAVLSVLGDPRFSDADGYPRSPIESVVHVAGGPSQIGTTRLIPADAVGGFVGEPRQLDFTSFQIGRYPVTNEQFRAFIDDDGYKTMKCWRAPRGRGWVSGDPEVLTELREHWMQTVYEHHGKEIRDGEIPEARLEEECDRRTASRQIPYYWRDRRFNQANQPVVGINWWEAAAFCEWATIVGHSAGTLPQDLAIVLPTEFEWEYASRPTDDDRIFPWGDEWDDEKAHVTTNTLNMRQPSPVGIYPEPWPGAPQDLAGNVWEWTATLYVPNDEEFDGQRLDANSLEERIVRGSSWYNPNKYLAACSTRAVDRSYNLFYDVGFRVLVHPIDAPRTGCR